ncbi:MAG: primosomal protein N' [Chloroflexi bacterium]|nr:MAG: primosomal protein N' [Chloroflexota bacterium]
MKYAEVAINAAVHKTFHYHIPDHLDGLIAPGHLVRVGFRTGMQPGIVLSLLDETDIAETKPIIERLHPDPILTDKEIQLARWISQRYVAPIGQCLWLWLPPGMTGKQDVVVQLLQPDANGKTEAEQRLIDMLKQHQTLRGASIKRRLGETWQKTVRSLVERGVIHREAILAPPTVKPLVVDVASLAINPDHIPHIQATLGKPNRLSKFLKQIIDAAQEQPLSVDDVLAIPGIGEATLDKLIDTGALRITSNMEVQLSDDIDQVLFDLRQGEIDLRVLRVLARTDSPVNVSWVYAQTGANREDLIRLAERGLIRLGQKPKIRDPLEDIDYVPMSAPRMTDGQRAVWRVLREEIQNRQTTSGAIYLLHGVTGSGKTEIYLRAIEAVIEQGRQAILLVPEIALTPQTVRRVLARFPNQTAIIGTHETTNQTSVGMVHGQLTSGERYDTWHKARAGQISVVVGTRSALFTPLPDVGLIILDEEHDHSYKQSAPLPAPHYHARDIAEKMMHLNKGILLLGSATPSIESYFRAQRGDIKYLHLPDRIMGHRVRIADQSSRTGIAPRYSIEPSDESDALSIELPDVKVIDMREELKAGNTDMFSLALKDALDDVLKQGQQAILLLNRRGASTYVFCRDCGYVVICPRCDTPMTYHEYGNQLKCHHCGYITLPPDRCAACGSGRIKYFGAGIQQVEAVLQNHFPLVRSLRWDSDTAAKTGEHDLILQRFLNHQADVLIGTQMIAKGLDLPLVTLVGVVSADVGLNLPDFRAAERTFQLLTQVAGRAGRGLLGGQVILQTYQPEHYAIQAASKHDYQAFYEREIAKRYELGYPPYRQLVRVLFRHERESTVKMQAEHAHKILIARLKAMDMHETTLIGPVPCFFQRVNQVYRWQIILRGVNLARVFEGMDIPANWQIDVDPEDVL